MYFVHQKGRHVSWAQAALKPPGGAPWCSFKWAVTVTRGSVVHCLVQGISNSNTRRPRASHHETERSFGASFLHLALTVRGACQTARLLGASWTMRLPLKLTFCPQREQKIGTLSVQDAFRFFMGGNSGHVSALNRRNKYNWKHRYSKCVGFWFLIMTKYKIQKIWILRFGIDYCSVTIQSSTAGIYELI